MVKFLLMYGRFVPSPEHVERLAKLRNDVHAVVVDSESAAIAEAPETGVILGQRYLRQTLPHTEGLQWVQSISGGIDQLICGDLLRISPVLTSAPLFADVIALHAFALALAVLRRIPEAVQAHAKREWDRSRDLLPFPRTAMILGMGRIGRALAAILRRNDIRVLGVVRRQSPGQREVCDEILTVSDWRGHLPRADLFFLALPLTGDTVGLVDDAAMEALPPHAIIVNVGRGETLDTAALLHRLRAGRLGGAALDAWPDLPADPVWDTPRLIVTRQVASLCAGRQQRLEQYIESQVKRYLDGEEPLNRIDYHSMGLPIDGERE
jgi:phosphoglycerate dehydrogenase-like enzyme